MRTFILALLMFVQTCSYALAATPPAESPEDFISRFYKGYIADYNRNAYWFNEPRKLSLYFDPSLIRLFMRDEACKEITKEICAIDYDPIIDAQDYDEKYPYTLAVTTAKKSPLKLKVVFWDGKKHFGGHDRRTIYYTLKKSGTRWLISDISYPDGRSLTRLLANHKPIRNGT